MERFLCRRFTADEVPPRTTPWGTQWGQLNRSLAARCLAHPRRGGLEPALRRLPALYFPLSRGLVPARSRAQVEDCYLVDSASSHMLVSKIKPCMSKYKQLYRETANGSLNQLSFI